MNMGNGNRIALLGLAGALMGGCGSLDSAKRAAPRAALLDLRITEIHYHPADDGLILGDEFEFVEIKNTGSEDLDLTHVGFTDGIDYTFPDGTEIEAGGFLVLASVPESFEDRYNFAPAGSYKGKLNNAGETLVLTDLPAKSVIDSASYSDESGWPSGADGGGYSLVPLSASRDAAKTWRASFRLNGSPGADDVGAAVISEVSTHTDPPASDAIELFNPEDGPLDVGGWYLSDDRDVPAKFRIPDGTVIPAKDYLVFDEADFNDTASATRFNMSAHGEEVWLFSDSAGCAAGYCHGFGFGEMENGVTFGRHVTSDGGEHFPAQKQPSLGTANAGPKIGPVILSEIMYHAANDTDDFLELTNVGGQPIDLFDRARPANTWRINGLAFRFPAGVTLAAGELALVIPVSVTEARIRSAYDIPATVRIFKAEGELRNSSDTLALLKPEDPYLKDGAAAGDSTVPFMVVDRVAYRDDAPWPVKADGEGMSLQRKALDAFGDDPGSWIGAKPGPGAPAK